MSRSHQRWATRVVSSPITCPSPSPPEQFPLPAFPLLPAFSPWFPLLWGFAYAVPCAWLHPLCPTPSPLPCVGLICSRAQGSIRASLSVGRLPWVFYLVSEHTLIPCYVSETLFKIYLIFITAPCSRPYHHSYCPDKESIPRGKAICIYD